KPEGLATLVLNQAIRISVCSKLVIGGYEFYCEIRDDLCDTYDKSDGALGFTLKTIGMTSLIAASATAGVLPVQLFFGTVAVSTLGYQIIRSG
ncbi:unnamed protein product, partial [Adineta steineri]